MRKRNIIICVIILAVVILGVLFFFLSMRELDGFRYNDDGTVELGEGYVSYGFHDKNRKVYDNASVILVDDGMVEGEYVFSQNMPQECRYGLIVMKDFRQTVFLASGESTMMYEFSLVGDAKKQIPMSIVVDDTCHEIEMLIVTEPDAGTSEMINKDGSYNWDNMFASKSVYVQRFFVNESIPSIEEAIPASPLQCDYLVGFDLVDCEEEMPTVFAKKTGGETARIIYGQDVMDTDYVSVVAFCNWKQVPLSNESDVLLLKIPRGLNGYYDIHLPECESGDVYQLFAFPEPNEFGAVNRASFRVILGKE